MARLLRSTDSRIAVSMFAILMAIANVGTGVGLGLSGVAVDTIDGAFVVIAQLNLLALPVIFPRLSKPDVARAAQ